MLGFCRWIRRARIASDLASLGSSIVDATIDIYQANQRELLPTPAKSHYTYNMRDLSKVFQGMAMVDSGLDDRKSLARLWAHECLRVFHDRLVSDEDREWFVKYLKGQVEQRLNLRCDQVFVGPEGAGGGVDDAARQLTFGDFMDPNADPKR